MMLSFTVNQHSFTFTELEDNSEKAEPYSGCQWAEVNTELTRCQRHGCHETRASPIPLGNSVHA